MTPSEVHRRALEIASGLSDATTLAGLQTEVRKLAVLVGSLAESPPAKPPVTRLEEGVEYDLVLRVRATVVDVSSGHGLSYQLKLESRDFYTGREVSVDHNEVASAFRR